jgi:hypothetical protein
MKNMIDLQKKSGNIKQHLDTILFNWSMNGKSSKLLRCQEIKVIITFIYREHKNFRLF